MSSSDLRDEFRSEIESSSPDVARVREVISSSDGTEEVLTEFLFEAIQVHTLKPEIVEIVEILIESGADVNETADTVLDIQGKWSETPLIAICGRTNAYSGLMYKYLGEKKLFENESESASILITNIVDKLLEAGAKTNVKNDSGMTPLHASTLQGLRPVVDRLLNHGADVNAKDDKNRTPLHYACIGDFTMVQGFPKTTKRLLKEENIKIDEQDRNGNTPLHCTFKRSGMTNPSRYVPENVQSLECLMTLIANGVDLDVTNKEGYTPLQLAVRAEATESVHYLLAAGASVQEEAINMAQKQDNQEILKMLEN